MFPHAWPAHYRKSILIPFWLIIMSDCMILHRHRMWSAPEIDSKTSHMCDMWHLPHSSQHFTWVGVTSQSRTNFPSWVHDPCEVKVPPGLCLNPCQRPQAFFFVVEENLHDLARVTKKLHIFKALILTPWSPQPPFRRLGVISQSWTWSGSCCTPSSLAFVHAVHPARSPPSQGQGDSPWPTAVLFDYIGKNSGPGHGKDPSPIRLGKFKCATRDTLISAKRPDHTTNSWMLW